MMTIKAINPRFFILKSVIPSPYLWLLGWLAILFVIIWQLPIMPNLSHEIMPLWLHTSAEAFSIIVDLLIFTIAWHAYSNERPGNIMILACGLLAVGLVDLAHVLSYRGMPDLITPSGREKGINFWLAARFINAMVMLTISLRGWQPFNKSQTRYWILFGFLLLTAFIYWMGFWHQSLWPRTFIEGRGLTPFKTGSELIISILLFFTAVQLYRKLTERQHAGAKLLFCAVVVYTMSELSFAFYSDVADLFNLLGHAYKIIAYIFIYQAVFVESIREPNSKLREAREELGFQRTLLVAQSEATMDGVLTVDANRKILFYNSRFIEIWQTPIEYLLAGDDEKVLADAVNKVHDPEVFQKRIEHLFSHHEEVSLDIIYFINGHSYERFTSPVLGRNKEYLGRVWRFHDITIRQANEKKLLIYQEQLADLVKERTQQLSEARDQAELANQAKSAFLSNMSHELRTPLNSVIGYSQLLSRDKTLKPEHQRSLNLILNSANHLLNLINSVLELSKIEAGAAVLTLKKSNLNDMLNDVMEMLRVRAAEKGLRFQLIKTDLPAWIEVDEFKLKQVLINLVGNAIKFTEKGAVTLQVAVLESHTNQVRLEFTISDTGIGIPANQIERIFSPFFQAESEARNEGTGLGLAISKRYIDLMGGELGVKSHRGKGSVFISSITVAKVEGTLAFKAVYDWEALTNVALESTILVVDDSNEARSILVDMIKPLGARILEASSGNHAKELVVDGQPDLVFMDWRMEDGDGVSATRWIRACKHLKQPRIAMLTAFAFDDRRQQALDAGSDDFLTKPISERELIDVLVSHYGLANASETLERELVHNYDEASCDYKVTELLKKLPYQQIESLKDAALMLDTKMILASIQNIRDLSPEVADYLYQLAQSLQQKRIWRILGLS